jgi:murein DD-endopeptidase MepM/ murein hydrolase activator NlpD
MGPAWRVLALAILVSMAGAIGWLRCERQRPEILAPERLHLGRQDLPVTVEATDEHSGIREMELRVIQGDNSRRVAISVRPGNLGLGGARGAQEHIEAVLNAEQLGLEEGNATFVAKARDWSLWRWFSGNPRRVEIPLIVDLTRPRIAVETGQTYVERGGAGAVVYRVGEETGRDGVQVADAFFPGRPFPGNSERRIALFAIPRDAAPSPRIAVIAEDLAGNQAAAGWPLQLSERVFDDVRIELSKNFLEVKVRDLAQDVGVDDPDPLAAFRRINSEIRAQNEQRIRELIAKSGDEPLFEGAFVQMRNSAVTSRFAERRGYFHDGNRVSEAIHYGYDLASTAGAAIEASNRGRVLYAGELGIYGNCVLLDHGLGLVSLYAHLSQIDVQEGQLVEKYGVLGRSGDTGLAGGDHLHFAILVGGVYVDPTEWWDAKWVEEKVMSRLGGIPAVAAGAETP